MKKKAKEQEVLSEAIEKEVKYLKGKEMEESQFEKMQKFHKD